MNKVEKGYRLLNLLSLDIAAGAIAGACYFAALLQVVVRPYAIASLGLTVWIIYTADHLLDARKVIGKASTDRHRFHQENFKILLILLVIGSIIDFILIFFIKRSVLYGGLCVLVFVVLYLLLQNHLAFLKELFAALLYCTGILLPSLLVTHVSLNETQYALIILFFTTALINLLMFSWFDKDHDRADKRQSFVTILGESKTAIIIWIFLVLNVVLSVYGVILLARGLFGIPLLMNLGLMSIFVFSNWFCLNDRYRLLGDAIFLIPFLHVIVS